MISVCVLSDEPAAAQQHLDEIRLATPANTLELSTWCDLDIAPGDASDQYDLGIVVIDNPSNTERCLALSQMAAKICRFTIAYVPVSTRTPGVSTDLLLLMLHQLEPIVDTVVLVLNTQQNTPADCITIVPVLLSGSGLIGIDYSDIRQILTKRKDSWAIKPGVCIVDLEPYSGPEDIFDAALSLGKRMSSMSPASFHKCLLSIPMASNKTPVTVQEVCSAAETIHEAICSPDSELAYSNPIVDPEYTKDGSLNIVCIAGHIKVTADWLDGLLIDNLTQS